ncbi:secretory protein [Nibribacter ruber]|uniref:Secretory protein n=1 Tax=Nibribacter ruber TaxID=2698458 RepID=A0A6P1P4K3_9BACT|nr:basic secretory protein-like protein [Nibribacter ruber]QHL89266.1 secretory protein [Nibribacter ruber]
MKLTITLLLAFSCLFSVKANAQTTTIKKGKYTLTFINQDPKLDPAIQDKLVNAFFKVYPKEAKRFNKNTVKNVTVTIDTAYTGVAYAHDGKITIASQWLHKRPNDIDVITHEAMHLVQAYPPDSGPGWLTEGIADYVRHVYGVDNAGANWSLPDLTDKHHYTNSYRITARFLLWVEKNFNKKLVDKLDVHMRNQTYTPVLWKALTGKTVDELWEAYKANPAI